MPFSIVYANLLQMETDAMVDGNGDATSECNRPGKYIIHASAPEWHGGSRQELTDLEECYRDSIRLAREKGCRSIAFPLISSQTRRFPKEIALSVALDAIREALQESDDLDVLLAMEGNHARASESLFPEIRQIIEQDYKPDRAYMEEVAFPPLFATLPELAPEQDVDNLIDRLLDNPTRKNLDDIPLDESFAQMLARLLAEKQLKHSEIYDQLGMTNVGFWKLLKGKNNPSKMTVFGLAVAFRLSIEDTKEMLMKAGYAINPSSLQDVIISGLIQKKIYDRYAIDDLLYALDLQLLPGAIIE
jgi:transcriptional regulator with XRE-family HTH domain